MTAVVPVKITAKRLPFGLPVQGFEYRKIAGQEGADITEKQITINTHAPVFDALGRRHGIGVADMGCKTGLQPGQRFRRCVAGHLCLSVLAFHVTGHPGSTCLGYP